MSYDLRIWQQPADQAIPDSFEEAVSIWSRLEGVESGPNPKFTALAEGMVELEDDGDSPWIVDPMAQARDCNSAVWAFSLPPEDRLRLLSAVVKRANALGLTVFDDQLGLMFCPPDRVLPPERAMMWQAAEEELDSSGSQKVPRKSWTLASIRKGIESSLEKILVPHRFVAERQPAASPYYHSKTLAEYFRQTPAGGQTVTLLGHTTDHSPCITIDLNVFSTQIADITQAVFPEHGETFARRQLNACPGLFYGDFYERIESPEDVRRLLKAVEDTVVPLLELTRTLAGMEAAMTGSVEFRPADLGRQTLAEYSHQKAGYAALISAWLHGNGQFEALSQEKREYDGRVFPALEEEMARRVDRVTNYLREKVQRGPSPAVGLREGGL